MSALTALSGAVKRAGVMAIKRGMTALWDSNGERVPLTVLQVMQSQVIHKKTEEQHGYNSLQFSFIDQTKKLKEKHKTILLREGVHPNRKLLEFPVTGDAILNVGDSIDVSHFVPGQFVDVSGISKGKGFAGPMKRWGFKGGPASHGASKFHRGHGSTGNRKYPGRVFPGKKMAGHMGVDKVTVQSLLLYRIDPARQLLLVKGAVPGPTGGHIVVRDAHRKRKTPLPIPTNTSPATGPSEYIPPPLKDN